jgi:hypothetical protein
MNYRLKRQHSESKVEGLTHQILAHLLSDGFRVAEIRRAGQAITLQSRSALYRRTKRMKRR